MLSIDVFTQCSQILMSKTLSYTDLVSEEVVKIMAAKKVMEVCHG